MFRPSGVEHNGDFFYFLVKEEGAARREHRSRRGDLRSPRGVPVHAGSQALVRVSEQACGSNRRTTC